MGIVYYWAQARWGYQQDALFSEMTTARYFTLVSVKTIFRYLTLMFFPMQNTRLMDDVPFFVTWAFEARSIIRIFLTGAILSYSFFGFVFGSKAVRFFIAWTFITLLPFTGITATGSWLNLNHLYLTSLGFCVILAAGGFIYNRQMVKEIAPKYRTGMPLGTTSDNGSGILLGQSVGAKTDLMERVSAWRFINPPEAFAKGMIVNKKGERYINEFMYGAAVGEAMVEENDGEAIVIIDAELKKLAREQCKPGRAQWFQRAPALLNLWFNTKALRAGGVSKATKDKKPGFSYWVRDKRGNPTGVGIEVTWVDAFITAGAWKPDVLMRSSQKVLYDIAAEQGWTSVLVPGLVTPNLSNLPKAVEDADSAFQLLEELDDKGELKLRTFLQLIYKNSKDSVDLLVDSAATLREKYDSDRVRAFGIKIHPEGNWITHTALMLEPYADEDTRGQGGVPPERVAEIVLAANAKGLEVSVHVDGSATLRTTVDAFEESINAGHADARNSLQHYINPHPDDHKRAIELDPEDPSARYYLGKTEEAAEDFEKAEEYGYSPEDGIW